MAKLPAEVKVGIYRLGWRYVELWLNREGCAGRVVTGPAEQKISVMTIGIDQSWKDVVDVLLHEAFEIAAWDEHSQFVRSGTYSSSTGSFVFHFDHAQFTEICAKAGYFLATTLPDVSKAYRKLTRKK